MISATIHAGLIFLLLTGVIESRTAEGSQDSARSKATIFLTAVSISPTDIELAWRDSSPNAAGHIVEWATEPEGDYVALAFVQPSTRSFVHSNVAPQTRCYYRIRPYIGPVSDPVEITTGAVGQKGSEAPSDETWADPKTTTAGSKASVRSVIATAEAAPANLTATLVHSTGILLTWIDQACDEEGYLLEIKLDKTPAFRVCALTDPDVTSFGYSLVPPETKAIFRVRAFRYGTPSNVAHVTTSNPGLWNWRMPVP